MIKWLVDKIFAILTILSPKGSFFTESQFDHNIGYKQREKEYQNPFNWGRRKMERHKELVEQGYGSDYAAYIVEKCKGVVP